MHLGHNSNTNDAAPVAVNREVIVLRSRTPSPASVEEGFATPLSDDYERHDLDHTSPRYRKLKHIYAELDTEAAEQVQLCLMAAEEPSSVSEALGEENWKRAMDAELSTIEDNGT